MILLIKILVLVSLIKLLLVTEQPILCAGIYTAIRFIFSLIFGFPFLAVLIGSAIGFGLAFLYFWLLDRFRETGVFWIVLILGLVIGLV